MELRHLRYFVAVAEEGSMTKAARRLGIQQPPLGQQIRALEWELGMVLFDRQPKKIVLNAAGALFLDEAREILEKVRAATERVRRFERGDSGKVTVGFTSSASLHVIAPQVLKAFRRDYPLAEIEVQESETYELILALQEGRVDAALLHISSEGFDDLTSIVLADEDMVVAVPIDHPLSKLGSPLTLEILAKQDFVVYRRPDGPGIFANIQKIFEAAGTQLAVIDEVNRMIATLNLVAAGRGISIVPATMKVLHTDAIAYLPLAAEALPSLPLYLIHRRHVQLQIVANFIALTARTAQSAMDAQAPRGAIPRSETR